MVKPEREVMVVNSKQIGFLKFSFMVGAVADLIVGINWLLISLGYDRPSLISFHQGAGTDYRFAMYIGTMFMFGWSALLFWGFFKPLERRDLLLLTAVFLAISIIVELLFYQDLLAGKGFAAGIVLRLLLISKFGSSYGYSFKGLPNHRFSLQR